MNIDFSLVRTSQAITAAEREDRHEQARIACKMRITAVLSPTAQLNLAADAAAGVLSTADTEAYKAWRVWVEEMRATWPRLADSGFAADAEGLWPVLPKGVSDLAQKY
ncbi:MAG: hypothetical protein AAFY25_11715 [Pseudomonadota bacterium]